MAVLLTSIRPSALTLDTPITIAVIVITTGAMIIAAGIIAIAAAGTMGAGPTEATGITAAHAAGIESLPHLNSSLCPRG